MMMEITNLITGLFSGKIQRATEDPLLYKIAIILIIIGVTKFFLMFSSMIYYKYLSQKKEDLEKRLVISVYKYIVWSIVALFCIYYMFRNIGALLTSLGLIGFGITFALQKPLLNFVGWLTVVINRPYNIGERIRIGKDRGDVQYIKIMYTTLKALKEESDEYSGKRLTIPNEYVLTHPIINYSKEGLYINDDLVISITYESNWERAVNILQNAADKVVKSNINSFLIPSARRRHDWEEAVKLLKKASTKLGIKSMKKEISENIVKIKDASKGLPSNYEKPTVLVEAGASSINLTARYMTHIDFIRDSRSIITSTFLSDLAKTDDIEIAYPHMQIVTQGKTKHDPLSRQLKAMAAEKITRHTRSKK